MPRTCPPPSVRVVVITSPKRWQHVCRTADTGICDPYPPQIHPWAKHPKRVHRQYVSTPRAASGSCPGSDEERQECSDRRKRTDRGDKGLSENCQIVAHDDLAVCCLPPKSLYLAFCDCLRPGEIKPGKTGISKHEMERQTVGAYSSQSPTQE